MIVRGGPGTGKSVLAINLLVELNNRNMTCFYVTKNAAPRSVYSSKLRGEYTQTYINHLFQGSGSFIDEERNKLDCLIVDEAHRLNEKSGLYQNKGENHNQIHLYQNLLYLLFLIFYLSMLNSHQTHYI